MKKSLSYFIAFSLLPVSSSIALADNSDAFTLKTVFVSASRLPQETSDVYNAVSVITRDDIDRLQADNIIDLMATVPGITTTQMGGKGGVGGFFIRGTTAAQSLVMIDGVRMAGAGAGAAAIENLSLDQIDRIEVIRGARSTIYGADAVGGVVQIFTRRAHQQGTSGRTKIAYGSHNSWERSVGVSVRDSETQANLNLSSEEVTGHNRSKSPDPFNQDKDAFRNHAVSLNASHKVTDAFKLSGHYLYQNGESEYDFGWMGNYPYDKIGLKNGSLVGDWKLHDQWRSRLELGYHENYNKNLFDDSPSRSFFNTRRISASWLNTLAITDAQTVQLGFDTYQDNLLTSENFSHTERRNDALFVQHQFTDDAFSTELGVRFDDNQAYGSNTTFNVGGAKPLTDTIKVFATYSQAFRAPGFNDLYYPGYSNANLKPEESDNIELKARFDINAQSHLEIAAYKNHLDQAITYDQNSIPQNTASADISGIEISYLATLKGWTIDANGTLLEARDEDSNKDLPRRPQQSANLEVSRKFGDFGFSTSLRGVSHSWDDAKNTRAIKGYALWNARVSYQANDSLVMGFKIENILDKTYSTALSSEGWPSVYRGYNELGRTATLSATWTPKLR